jgi:ApeA N-terminal domain 1
VSDYLSDSADWWGHFWLPGERDQAKPGVLAYTPEGGPVLSVIGELIPRGQPRVPVVHGFADNTPITLLDCIHVGGTVYGFVTGEQKIRAEQALIGINLQGEATKAFVGIEVQVENLTEWAAQSHIRYEEAEVGQPWRWQVIIERPAPSAQRDGVTAELHGLYQLPGVFDRRRSGINVAARESSFIRFESQKPRPLADWLDLVDMVRDLVSLAMDTPCAVLKQTLLTSEVARDATDPPARSEVLVYAHELVQGQPEETAVEAREALFTLHDIEFGAVLPAWAEVRQRVTMACHMVLGLKYISEGYLETKLLTAVGAAEVMHRKLGRPAPLPKDEFNELKTKLLDVVPEGRKEWLKGKLYNEPSLKERLIDLASIPDPDVMNRLLPDPKTWAKDAALARNLIAHRGRHSINKYLPVVEVTTAVVIINLLHLLAIPKNRVLRALEQNASLRVAVQVAAEHWPKKDNG